MAGHHIVWQTGQQNGPDGAGPDDHTHCSAFVAAVALDLDIDILRPPVHPQELLANAQVTWLASAAAAVAGWRVIGNPADPDAMAMAVSCANMGKLVVGGYLQPASTDPATGQVSQKPGHVVIVRPQPADFPADAGPLCMMAGTRNWRLVHMDAAFSTHPDAWPAAIGLFVHDTDLEANFIASP